MAKIVSQGVRLVPGNGDILPYASRVLGCGSNFLLYPALDFCCTLPVGERVWLLGVSVWVTYHDVVGNYDTRFAIKTDTGVWNNPAQVLGFEDIVPMPSIDSAERWRTFARNVSFHFGMKRLYVGAGRRFGLWVWADSPAVGMIRASFEVAEV